MSNRKVIYGTLLALLTVVLILAGIVVSLRKNVLKVTFLDVGQGDSILISQGLNQVLLDGGKDGKALLEKLGKYIPFWDRNIEMIIASHPDQDHIGGLIDVLKSYRVNSVLETNAQSESATYKELEEKIIAKNAQKIEAKKGVTIKFPDGTTADVLYPVGSMPEAIDNAGNDHSVVMKLVSGENSFLFTGDLPTTSENEIIAKNVDIKADILKVAHHGSKYATSNEFLDAVKPAEAIISVGKNNSYGHPNQEVLQRFLQHKIKIFRTDELGDIIYECADRESKCQIL